MGVYTYQVQRSTNGGVTWSDITGASGSFTQTPPFTQDVPYTIQSADSSDYLRLKVTDPNGIVKYSSLIGPVSSGGGGGTLSGCYFSARIHGAFYQSYYGSASANDAPWAAVDPAPNNWDLFETHAGKKVAAVLWGGSGSGITTFDKNANTRARSRGAFSLYSMAPSYQQVLDLANNSDVNGTLSLIDTWATDVASQNFPLMLRPMWEMNGNWGYAWQTNQGITATQYVAAWKTLYNRVNAKALCVSFCWCPNIIGSSSPDPTPWFPGTAYVEWVGCDGYNKGANISPSSSFSATLSTLVGLAPGKPVAICEVGCEAPTSYTGGKSQWITDFFTWLAANPSVKLFSWFNHTGSPVWPHIEVGNASTTFDAEVETAFKNGIASSHYISNIVTTTTFPSGQKVPIPS